MIPPDPHSGRGRSPSGLNTQRGLWPGAGRKHPVVGTQTLVPLNFSVVVVHRMRLQSMSVEQCVVLCCVGRRYTLQQHQTVLHHSDVYC